MTEKARWTITGLDSEYLWVLQRSLEMYGDYLETLNPPPKDNLKRVVRLGTHIIAESASMPFIDGTIDVSDVVQEIQRTGKGFRR